MSDKPIRLNLGAGVLPLPGYINVDRSAPDDSHLVRGEVFPLIGWENDTVDEIRASHVLEHFSHTQTADVLKEWIRVLKPGGLLKIAVPDFAWIAQQYVENPNGPAPILGYVMGGHIDDNDQHGAIFDWDGFAKALAELGMVDIQRWESEVNDCAALPVSLNIQSRKPSNGEAEDMLARIAEPVIAYEDVPDGVSIDEYRTHPSRRYAGLTIPKGDLVAVMSSPRLGFVETSYVAHKAFAKLDIPWEISGGVYWQKSIERVLDVESARGAKYILTLDYDTVFDHRDVQSLYGLMEDNPEVGAICAMQMRRDLGTVLVGMRDPDTDEPLARISLDRLQDDLLPVATGHFGLTIIRAGCLKSVPRPWFEMVPSPEGKWDEHCIDADVNFWLKFRAAGFQLCQANRVVIGHLELVVTWPDAFLRPTVQPSGQYHAYGRPGEGSGVWR